MVISNNTLLLATSILWYLPMLVYHNSNLKYFFAVLGSTGIVVFLAQAIIDADPVLLLFAGQLIAYLSLQNKKIMAKNWKSNIGLFAAALLIFLILPEPIFSLPVLCFAVMWRLQKIAVIDYLRNEKVNPFYVALVVYQVLTVLYSVLFIVGHIYLGLTNIIYSVSQLLIIVLLLLLKKSEKPMIAKLSLSP